MKTAYSTIHAKPTTCFHYILGVTFFNFITKSVIFKLVPDPSPPHAMAVRYVIDRQSSPAVVDRRRQ